LFAGEIIDRGGKVFPINNLETLYACIGCGTCVGSCPSGRRTALRVRSIMSNIQLGFKDEVLSCDDLWLCTTCYTCQERCPRSVMTTDIIRTVRNIAFEKGYVKERHLVVISNFIKAGHSIMVSGEVEKVRVELGLDRFPPTTLRFKEALDEIKKIMEVNGFQLKLRGKEGE